MQASVGAVANRLQLASSRIQDTQTNTTAALSNVQDADMAAHDHSSTRPSRPLTARP